MGERRVDVRQLAEWWTQATAESRWLLLRASVEGEAQAPPLRALHIAIYLAEAEKGEVERLS
jgi:hypothetical protein